MIKKILNGKKMKISQNILVTYLIFLYMLIPSIGIYFIFNFIILRKASLIFLLIPLIYFSIYELLQKILYKKIKIDKNVIISFFVLVLIVRIPFSYIFLPISLILLLRDLKVKDSIFVAMELVKNNIFRILFTYFAHIFILSIVFSAYFIIKINFFENIILTNNEVYKYILKNSMVLSYFSPLIFSISSFLLYKNLEQNDIIRGGING